MYDAIVVSAVCDGSATRCLLLAKSSFVGLARRYLVALSRRL